jgi:K+-sensing histidine kinase KdpD
MSVLDADNSLVAVLSHQLINDLAVIVGAASTLLEHGALGSEKRQKLLEAIEHHGYLAARLVETLAHGGPGDLDVLYAFGPAATASCRR